MPPSINPKKIIPMCGNVEKRETLIPRNGTNSTAIMRENSILSRMIHLARYCIYVLCKVFCLGVISQET